MSSSRLYLSKSLFVLSSVLPLFLAAPVLALPHSTLKFSDAGNHWAAGCIEGVGEEGLMKGYLDGRFQPNGTMTRAEFAAVMVKAFPNAPAIRDEPNFSDVSPDFWGWSAIKVAYSRGFLSGYPDNLFKPAQPISRAQSIIVIAKAQSSLAQNTAADADAVVLQQYFQDAGSIPVYARPGIATATRSGLVVNYPNVNRLRPNDSITRGEATALLCRVNKDGSDARYYVDTTYIAAFGDQFDLDGLPKASEQPEPTVFKTLEPDARFSFFPRLKIGDRLFSIDDSREVANLWQTDGTAAGTWMVRALDSNGDRSISTNGTRFIGASETRLWLITYPYKSPNAQRAALWSSDLNDNTTQEAADFSPALAEALSQATDINAGEYVTQALNDRIPFFIETEQETQLWMIDGKSHAGTQQIATFSTTFRENEEYRNQQIVTTNGYVFFLAAAAADGDISESIALWRTDGTPEGTIPLQTIGAADPGEVITGWNNQVYFTVVTPETGRELWVSDGTQRGTQLLKDIYPGPKDSDVSVIGSVKDTLFMLGNTSTDRELWATTGSSDSTRLVSQLGSPKQIGEKGTIYPSSERQLFFNGSDASSAEMWVTDGTEIGTRPVLLGEVYSGEAVALKDQFFFSNRTINGEELWVSGGAASNTYQLADLTPGEVFTPPGRCSHPIPGDFGPAVCEPASYDANSTSPQSLTVLGDYLYFATSNGRLFRTDGTIGRTELIDVFDDDSIAGGPIKLNDRILFATRGDHTKLWSIAAAETLPPNGFNRHTSSGVFAIDYPQSWYIESSERDFVSIWNQQPNSSRQQFPPGFAKTEVHIHDRTIEDIVQGHSAGRGSYNAGTLVKSENLTVDGREAYRVFFEGGENGEDQVITYIRYSDTQTAMVTSVFTSGETENISAILRLHRSFRVD